MDRIVLHHSGSDFGKFWKYTNRLYGTHGLPVSVDSVTDELNIANSFRENFTVKSPLGLSQTVVDAELGCGQVYTLIKAKDIRITISRTKRGKSP